MLYQPKVCIENTARGGCREINTARGGCREINTARGGCREINTARGGCREINKARGKPSAVFTYPETPSSAVLSIQSRAQMNSGF